MELFALVTKVFKGKKVFWKLLMQANAKPYFSAETLVTVRITTIFLTLLPYSFCNGSPEIK